MRPEDVTPALLADIEAKAREAADGLWDNCRDACKRYSERTRPATGLALVATLRAALARAAAAEAEVARLKDPHPLDVEARELVRQVAQRLAEKGHGIDEGRRREHEERHAYEATLRESMYEEQRRAEEAERALEKAEAEAANLRGWAEAALEHVYSLCLPPMTDEAKAAGSEASRIIDDDNATVDDMHRAVERYRSLLPIDSADPLVATMSTAVHFMFHAGVDPVEVRAEKAEAENSALRAALDMASGFYVPAPPGKPLHLTRSHAGPWALAVNPSLADALAGMEAEGADPAAVDVLRRTLAKALRAVEDGRGGGDDQGGA